MAILEGLVILTIVLAAGYVGYHTWQEWLMEEAAEDAAEAHEADMPYGLVAQQAPPVPARLTA